MSALGTDICSRQILTALSNVSLRYTYAFDGFDVVAKLQEELSILLLDAEFLDVEATESVEEMQGLQRRLDSTNARLHERLQVRLQQQH